MEPMIIGANVPSPNGAPFTVYTQWTPRQGNTVRMGIEVIVNAEARLTVQTKNREDNDSGITDVGNGTVASGVLSVRVTGVKELVRAKITTNPNSEAFGLFMGHFRVLDPQWES